MNILIVGSGPSAYASLLPLLSDNKNEIVLIDNSDFDKNYLNEQCIYKSKFTSGNRIADNQNIYDNSNNLEDKSFPFSSKSFGGFSNVWGGTIFYPTNTELEKFTLLNIDIMKYINLILNETNLLSSEENYNSYELTMRERKIFSNLKQKEDEEFSVNFSKTWLSKNSFEMLRNKNVCEFCKSYIWDCRSEKIWNSKSFIKKNIEENNLNYLPKTKLLSFNDSKDKVTCTLKNNSKTYLKEFDKVFLCCGAISTSSIVMNSLNIPEVEIKTSDMISFPYFTIFRKGNKKHSLSDMFLIHESKTTKFFIQLYGYSKGLLNLAGDAIPVTKLLTKLPNLLFKNFGGIFMYMNEENSSTFKMLKTTGKYKFIAKKKNYLDTREIQKIKKNFYSSGVFPLFFLKKFYTYGTSNHYGGQFAHSLSPGELGTDRKGRIKGLKNVHILDSSVLPVINTGPFTITMMANSYRIAEEINN
jgi:hypothetical protein